MAMSSDTAIKKWKPEKDGEAHGTGGRSGLYIRGWANGTKVFYFRAAGTWLRMAEYPDTTLAQARDFALIARRLIAEGFGVAALQRGFGLAKKPDDLAPIVKGETATGIVEDRPPTYNEVFCDWYRAKAPKLQDGPSRRRPLQLHDRLVSATIGERPVTEIRRREIFDLLAPAFVETRVSAGHALRYIRAVFDYAVTREIIDGNPTPPLRAFDLDAHDVRHHGTIDPEALPTLWRHIEASGATPEAKAAILLAMVTAHRISVVTHLQFDHIDVKAGVWTVPRRTDKTTRGRMKSGRAHALHLPRPLLDRLLDLRRDEAQLWVFPSPVRARPISEAALVKTLKTFDKSLTAHGFRNAAKIFARRAGVPDYVADALVDHAPQGLDKAYRRDEGLRDLVGELIERLFAHVTGEGSPTK